MKSLIHIIILITVFSSTIMGQLKLTVTTDKDSYSSGEQIIIKCNVQNVTDTTVKVECGSFDSGQAEFQFNNFKSWENTFFLPMYQTIAFPRYSIRTYQWTLDPKRFGIPDKDGIQTLIGDYFTGLIDTTYITCEKYLGGQLYVNFPTRNDSLLSSLRDSLNVEVLERDDFYNNSITELWQINGFNLDTTYSLLSRDNRIYIVDFNRKIMYDSITVTSVNELNEMPNSYKLSDAFPNPFNPSTKIRYVIPKAGNVQIKVFDILGREIAALIDEFKPAGNYEIEFNTSSINGELPSGIYFYRMKSGSYSETKKLMLLK